MIKFILRFLLFPLLSVASFAHVTILYFNDAHEIAPVSDHLGERGGVARTKTVIENTKRENPNTIVVFGGDLAGGSLFGGFYHGFPIVEAFNKIPVDIATFGQHDFDFGTRITEQLVDSSHFQWFSSNLQYKDGTPFNHLPTLLTRQVADLHIGFIGLTDDMHTTSRNDLVQVDLLQATRRALEKLIHVDVILAVTQTAPETNEKLLRAFPQIDAILTEERSENLTHIFYVGDRPVISPCGNMGSVARLDITKEKTNISLCVSAMPVDSTVQEHPELYKIQQKYQAELESELATVISYTSVPLDAGINTDFRCRWAETNIGNLIADAFRHHHNADIAVINGGGIRANIAAGAITSRDVLAALPFGNKVCLVEMSGQAIWDMLEHGVSDVENHAGQFLQISGAAYSYDWNAPPGERVLEVRVRNIPLDPTKMYTVSMPDFVLLGGNNLGIEKSSRTIVHPNEAPLDFQVVTDFICKRTLTYHIEGRIKIANRE